MTSDNISEANICELQAIVAIQVGATASTPDELKTDTIASLLCVCSELDDDELYDYVSEVIKSADETDWQALWETWYQTEPEEPYTGPQESSYTPLPPLPPLTEDELNSDEDDMPQDWEYGVPQPPQDSPIPSTNLHLYAL